jgi:hypothetical protein
MMTFAHYWGIDEVGVFVLPVVLAIVALRWAERRARRAAAEKEPTAKVEEGSDAG